jgi:hypothetical protein
MRYAHIFCGWSKRLKRNENRRAFIRSAWLCFVASTSRSHAPQALLDEAIDDPSAKIAFDNLGLTDHHHLANQPGAGHVLPALD